MSQIQINSYDSGNQPQGQTWDTRSLQEDFTVEGFSAPYVAVVRKSDGKRGTLEFTHSPRVYFGFKEDELA